MQHDAPTVKQHYLELIHFVFGRSCPSTSMAQILSIAYNESLLVTRRMILERMGHTVRSVENLAEAQRLFAGQDGHFDLIIVGHSVPYNERIEIVKQSLSRSSHGVLALLRLNEEPVPGADRSITSAEPPAFMDAVTEMLSG